MESFNLLRYWRNGGQATTIVHKTTASTSTLSRPTKQSKMDDVDDDPFFDLHFALPTDGRHRLSLSDPSNHLFFHRRLPSTKPNSIPRLRFPFTVTTSAATKVRVLMQQQKQNISKFPIKIKVEEHPFASLFTRDNTPRSRHDDDRRFSKEALQKYVSKMKPLYDVLSKRYGEVLRLSGLLGFDGAGDRNKSPKVGMRVGGKRLGKSKPAPLAFTAMQAVPARRMDDSLRQQEDGIQSAIAHCKQSLTPPPGGVGRSISDLGGGRLGSHPAFPVLIGRD